MTQYLGFAGPGNTTIVLEIEHRGNEVGRTGAGHDLISAASSSLSQSLGLIRNCAYSVIEQIKDLPKGPTEVEVTFGVKASGELGHFVIAKASTEANFEVKLRWDLRASGEHKPPSQENEEQS